MLSLTNTRYNSFKNNIVPNNEKKKKIILSLGEPELSRIAKEKGLEVFKSGMIHIYILFLRTKNVINFI